MPTEDTNSLRTVERVGSNKTTQVPPNTGDRIRNPLDLHWSPKVERKYSNIGEDGIIVIPFEQDGGTIFRHRLNEAALNLFNPKLPAEFGPVVLEALTPNSIRVTWPQADRAQFYTVLAATKHLTKEAGGSIHYDENVASNLSVVIEGLPSKQRILVQVAAHNKVGPRYADTVDILLDGDPPVTPINLGVKDVGSNQATLTWKGTDQDFGYQIQYTPNNYVGADAKTIDIGVDNQHVLRALVSETKYRARIRSKNSNGLPSAWSDSVPFETLAPQSEVPLNLIAKGVSASQIDITFDEARNADSYQAQIALVSQGFSDETTGVFDTGGLATFSFTELAGVALTPDTDYLTRVRAYNQNNTSAWSANVIARTFPPALATPQNLKGRALSLTSLNLSWDEVVGKEAYHVEYNYGEAPTAGLSWNTVTTEGITLNGLNPASYVWVRVRAAKRNQNSPWSEPILIYLGSAGVPQNLRVTDFTSETISLTWDEVSNADGYELLRATDAAFTKNVLVVIRAKPGFDDINLEANVLYYYKVRSRRGQTTFPYSQPVSQRTQGAPPRAVSWSSGGSIISGNQVGDEIGILQASGGQGPYQFFLAPSSDYPNNTLVFIDAGSATVRANSQFTQNSITIHVIARNESGASDPQPVLITVQTKPYGVGLDNATISESTPEGSLVGEFSHKGDQAGTTYALFAGNGDTHNTLFEIIGDTLRLRQPLSRGTYSIRVRTRNGFGFVENIFQITVQEAPTKDPTNLRLVEGNKWDWDAGNPPTGLTKGSYSNGVFTYTE